jgi:hypothetical protein
MSSNLNNYKKKSLFFSKKENYTFLTIISRSIQKKIFFYVIQSRLIALILTLIVGHKKAHSLILNIV